MRPEEAAAKITRRRRRTFKLQVFNSHAEADQADREYWWAQTPAARLRALEGLRQLNYNYGSGKPCPRFQSVLKLLNSAKINYLVVGGYAVAYYGYHRMTDDLDIWIPVDARTADLIARVLQKFGGFSPRKVKPSMFLKPGMLLVFGREPVIIDIVKAPHGVQFTECHSRRNKVNWDGLSVSLICLEDLRRNKLASGRLKDLADLGSLPAPN